MSELCTPEANALSEKAGGFDCDASWFLELRNPADLANWTLPVLEVLMVFGAVLALVTAVRRLRAGDPTLVAMALAGVVYVLVVEIPMYFPEKFGAGDYLGTVFVHNVFTVEFIVDRLPLYIVCLYIALPVLAYEIVRALGVFERRGAALAALCVGVVHSAFYEVFDHLGPQLRWWAWNEDNDLNHPLLASVPMTSVTLFSVAAPAGLTWMIRRFVAGRTLGRTLGWGGTLGRGAVIGALVPLTMTIAAIPYSLAGDNVAARAVILAVEFALAWLVAVPVLAASWRGGTSEASAPVRLFGPVYLVTMAALWLTGPEEGPVGSLPFAAFCLVAAMLFLAATRTSKTDVEPAETEPATTAD